MRTLILAALLSLAACSVNSQYSAPWTVKAVGKTYEARDACLQRQAAPYADDTADASSPRTGALYDSDVESEVSLKFDETEDGRTRMLFRQSPFISAEECAGHGWGWRSVVAQRAVSPMWA